MIHEIRVTHSMFEAVGSGRIPFIILRNNGYAQGEYLALNEISDNPKLDQFYSGRCMLVRIGSIFSNEEYLIDDHVILTVIPCEIKSYALGAEHCCYGRDGLAIMFVATGTENEC